MAMANGDKMRNLTLKLWDIVLYHYNYHVWGVKCKIINGNPTGMLDLDVVDPPLAALGMDLDSFSSYGIPRIYPVAELSICHC